MKLRTIGHKLQPSTRTKLRPPAKQTDPFYHSPEYLAWRGKVIARAKGRCQDPEHEGDTATHRLVADHIKERRDAPHLELDPNNGMARCWPCHTRKTAAERAKRLGLTR